MPTQDELLRDAEQLAGVISRGQAREDRLTEAGRVLLSIGRGQRGLQDLNREGQQLLGYTPPPSFWQSVGQAAQVLGTGVADVGRRPGLFVRPGLRALEAFGETGVREVTEGVRGLGAAPAGALETLSNLLRIPSSPVTALGAAARAAAEAPLEGTEFGERQLIPSGIGPRGGGAGIRVKDIPGAAAEAATLVGVPKLFDLARRFGPPPGTSTATPARPDVPLSEVSRRLREQFRTVVAGETEPERVRALLREADERLAHRALPPGPSQLTREGPVPMVKVPAPVVATREPRITPALRDPKSGRILRGPVRETFLPPGKSQGEGIRVAPTLEEVLVRRRAEMVKKEPEFWGPPGMRAPRAQPVQAVDIFDPNVPPDRPLVETYWARLWGSIRKRTKRTLDQLPQDLRIINQVPDSPVITEFARHGVELEDGFRAYMPGLRQSRALGSDPIMAAEQRAVDHYKELVSQGVSEKEAEARGVATYPRELRAVVSDLLANEAAEDAIRLRRKLPPLSRIRGPYLPHVADKDYREWVRLTRQWSGLGSDLQTSLGAFGEHRVARTMLEGMAHDGIVYEEPVHAMALRLWTGLKMRKTFELVDQLERKGVLFRDAADALKANPTRTAWKSAQVRIGAGFPEGGEWFARTRPEAIFINHMSQASPEPQFFAGSVHLANQFFRNPNLFNPLPHFLKNMAYKYRQAGGSLIRMTPDMLEYFRDGNPSLKAEFLQDMPFTKTGETAHDLLSQMLRHGPVDRVIRIIGQVNKPSSRIIFSQLDPALRYALYKQRRAAGMPRQVAANHVWADLVRYDTRSDLVNRWRSFPGNFFVPWRIGTVVSLTKQLQSRPLRTALWIGGVDLLRESYYRATGNWLHLPIDYVEGPAALIRDHPVLGSLAVGTATTLFGPGGAFAAAFIRDAAAVLTGTEDWTRIVNVFWGLGQIANLPGEAAALARTGDPKHVMNILTGLALGTHPAVTHEPRRVLGKLIPESVPGFARAPTVKRAELAQAELRRRREAQASARLGRVFSLEAVRHGLTTTPEERQLETLGRRLGVGRR